MAVFAGVAMQFDPEDKTQKECRLVKTNLFSIQHIYMSFSKSTDLKVGKGKILAAKTSTGFPPKKRAFHWECQIGRAHV